MIGTDRLAFMASLGFSRMEPAEVVAILKQLGYGGVEWTLAHFNPRTTSKQQRRELIEVTRDAGLAATEIVVQQDLVSLDENVRRDRIDLVKECIEAAQEAGVGILNVFSGPAPWNPKAPKLGSDISEAQAWDQVIEAYTELAALAEAAQVRLAVEAVFGMLVRDYYTLHQLLTAVDSPFLLVNFDPSHLVLYRNDPVWVIRQLGGRIVHCHLKDVAGVPPPPADSFIFPLLGEGNVPWGAVLDALNEIAYEGYLSVEFESFKYYQTVLGEDPAKAAGLSMEQCKALLTLQKSRRRG